MVVKRNVASNETAFDSYVKRSKERLEELKENLKFDKHDLDNELIHQPHLYFQVGEAYAQSISIRDEAKFNRDREYAEISRLVRREASEAGEKITEAQVDSRIKESPSYENCIERYRLLCENADIWLALKEAYQQRSYAIKDECGLWVAGYYSDSVGSTERNDARDRKSSEIRSNMAEARRRIADRS